MTEPRSWEDVVALQRSTAIAVDALVPEQGEHCSYLINHAHEALMETASHLKSAGRPPANDAWTAAYRIVRDATMRFNRRVIRAEILTTIASVSRDAQGVLARVGEAMAHGR